MNTKREWAHKEHVLRELDVQLDFLSRELAEVKLEQGKVHAAMERAMFQSACSEQLLLTGSLQYLWKKEEQLRDKENRVREQKLVVLEEIKLEHSGGSAPRVSSITTYGRGASPSQGSSGQSKQTKNGEGQLNFMCRVLDLNIGRATLLDDLSPAMSITDVKKRMFDQHGITSSAQSYFSTRGVPLKDDKTLGYYGITSGGTIHMRISNEHIRVAHPMFVTFGKPVILLYPANALKASVRLSLCSDGKFTTLYPKPSCDGLLPLDHLKGASLEGPECAWNVSAKPDGCLQDLNTGKEYPYLFWEADFEGGGIVPASELSKILSFCIAGDQTGVFLNDALMRLGLNMRERCDMITYWLESMERSPFNVIYFVDQERLARAAQLTVSPRPDVLIRICMVFKGLEAYDAQLDTAELGQLDAPPRDGFVVVEWGGMNLKKGNHIM